MKSFELTKDAKEDLRKTARFTEKRWGRDQRFCILNSLMMSFIYCLKTHHLASTVNTLKKPIENSRKVAI